MAVEQRGYFSRKLPATDAGAHQAVLLSNGQVYFALVEDPGGSYLILTDIYYIQTQTDTATKQPIAKLVHRGKEIHEPSRMIVNRSMISYVEDVGEKSQVATFISDSRKR